VINLNPTQQLAEIILGRPLGAYVAEKRAEGLAWRKVAIALNTDTAGRIDVSYEALRVWYADEEAVA
jgi:hypothetical protein